MSGLVLADIYRYPLKSARGERLQAALADQFGLAGDRRWMLVDEQGVFVSQRSTPALALLCAATLQEGVRLSHGADVRAVETPAADARSLLVDIWGDRISARCAAASDSAWISARLGRELRLVYLPDTAQRPVDPGFAGAGELIAFSDGFPLLVVTQASLDGLNARLSAPVPMDRFRPNLVITGAEAHAEDGWQHLRIGAAQLRLVKPCSRCAIPSVDQVTGGRDRDINRALASYRRRDGKIYFGMNALVPAGASFAVGDEVEVLH